MDPARGQLLVHRARVVTVAAAAGPGGHGQQPGTAMSDPPDTQATSRRENGVSAYAKIFAVPEQEVPAALVARVGPVFAEEALQAAGGAGWSSPALTGRERSITIITALAAQGVAGIASPPTCGWACRTASTRTRSRHSWRCWPSTSDTPRHPWPWKPSIGT